MRKEFIDQQSHVSTGGGFVFQRIDKRPGRPIADDDQKVGEKKFLGVIDNSERRFEGVAVLINRGLPVEGHFRQAGVIETDLKIVRKQWCFGRLLCLEIAIDEGKVVRQRLKGCIRQKSTVNDGGIRRFNGEIFS